jgi:hypothetical protein
MDVFGLMPGGWKSTQKKGMILGLHSLLFQTKVKAAGAIISSNQALDSLIR